MKLLDTPKLIDNLRAGDPHTFTALFEFYYRPLCFFANDMVAATDAAEDIVKDTFVKLWVKRLDFENAQKIKAFLYISVKNACINASRHLQVRAGAEHEIRAKTQPNEDFVLNRMIRAELMSKVYHAIEALPEKRRNVFKMCYIEGMRNDEIAEALGISIHTVKEHKGKALEALRKKFNDQDLMIILVLLGTTVVRQMNYLA